jgi:hypothetical protein
MVILPPGATLGAETLAPVTKRGCGVATTVAVGGTPVAVGGATVAVGGTAVAVGGTTVAVAGTRVAVAVGGTALAVGVALGPPSSTRLSKLVSQPLLLLSVRLLQTPVQPVVIVANWPATTVTCCVGWPGQATLTVLALPPPL